jgi:hypothetical protein
LEPSPYEKNYIMVKVKLSLKFINEGKEPVLLLTERAPYGVGGSITKTPGPAVGENLLDDDNSGPDYLGTSEWSEFRTTLDQGKPPIGIIKLIEPGGSLDWPEYSTVVARVPTKFADNRIDSSDLNWETLKQASPVFLRLKFETWPFNVEKLPDPEKARLGHQLQKRWRAFGLLQLAPLVSEPMLLTLPDPPSLTQPTK